MIFITEYHKQKLYNLHLSATLTAVSNVSALNLSPFMLCLDFKSCTANHKHAKQHATIKTQ